MIELKFIEPGSIVLLHSSISRTLRKAKGTPDELIAALLNRLGPKGTLLLPLFNFDFTKGVSFDIRRTPSRMGALTEAGRTWPGAVRTGHPIYSFAAIGSRAEEFADVDNKSGYGADSPFAMLRSMGGEIAVLDLPDQNSMTFYHHVEEMVGVPYRYHKVFTAPYTDAGGRTEQRSYSIFVRDLENGVLTSVDRMGERLWLKGHYRGDRPGEGSGLRVIGAAPLFDEVQAVIEAGEAENYLYAVEKS